jgi:SpoVK/Ycf46/Vps4 family AAA+-type ATPase
MPRPWGIRFTGWSFEDKTINEGLWPMSPEYLFPGVYIEEVPTNPRPISGVSTRKARNRAHLPAKARRELQTISACLRKKRSGARLLCIGRNKNARLSVARALALDLHLDLYRIDLGGIVSKYIGETEKNLDRIFDIAEDSHAILFFDEADALFGKRSEVKDSHDRYANLEVSYLLKRIEGYPGLVMVATNRKENLDAAFLRRFRFIIPIAPEKTNRSRKPARRRAKRAL